MFETSVRKHLLRIRGKEYDGKEGNSLGNESQSMKELKRMFTKIVVAIDGSEMSHKVLDTAFHLAKEQQSELNVVYVGKEAGASTAAFVGMTYVPEDYFTTMIEELKREGEQILHRAAALAEQSGIQDLRTYYMTGDPAQMILDFAQQQSCDLIIVGSRGLSGIKELMLGSVSHKVSQYSKCPVLIVR